jgi:hypothetical protein
MSGSPPLPPKTSHEVAERAQGTYHSSTQDVYRGLSTAQSEESAAAGTPGRSRSFLSDSTERPPYTFAQLDVSVTTPPAYTQQLEQVGAQPTPYLQAPGIGAVESQFGPRPAPRAYPTTSHHSIQESLPSAVPKPQRKAKGHVASACVPCKKAHLRFVHPFEKYSWSRSETC